MDFTFKYKNKQMKTKIKLTLIGIVTIATLIFLGSCKKKTVEPAPVQTIQTQQLDTNYVTIQVQWSAPAGSSMKYYIMTGLKVVSTKDTFQYKRDKNELLMVQLNTNTNISAPLSFTICALSNKHLNGPHGDTLVYQINNVIGSVNEYGYVFN